MAIIPLGSHWRAVSDAQGWALERHVRRTARLDDPDTGRHAGDEYDVWVAQKFYGRLEQMMSALPDLQLRRLEADNLYALLAEMQRFREDVLAVLAASGEGK